MRLAANDAINHLQLKHADEISRGEITRTQLPYVVKSCKKRYFRAENCPFCGSAFDDERLYEGHVARELRVGILSALARHDPCASPTKPLYESLVQEKPKHRSRVLAPLAEKDDNDVKRSLGGEDRHENAHENVQMNNASLDATGMSKLSTDDSSSSGATSVKEARQCMHCTSPHTEALHSSSKERCARPQQSSRETTGHTGKSPFDFDDHMGSASQLLPKEHLYTESGTHIPPLEQLDQPLKAPVASTNVAVYAPFSEITTLPDWEIWPYGNWTAIGLYAGFHSHSPLEKPELVTQEGRNPFLREKPVPKAHPLNRDGCPKCRMQHKVVCDALAICSDLLTPKQCSRKDGPKP